MSRWLDNGDKRARGLIIFWVLLTIALIIILTNCSVYNIEEPPGKNYYEGYDDFKIMSNGACLKFKLFSRLVEDRAELLKANNGWERIEIKYFDAIRLHGKHVQFAVIFYWEKKSQ